MWWSSLWTGQILVRRGLSSRRQGKGGRQRRVDAPGVLDCLPQTDIQEAVELNTLLSTLCALWGCALPTPSRLTLRDLCGLVGFIYALPIFPEDFLFLLVLKQRGLARCVLPGRAQESLPARGPGSPFLRHPPIPAQHPHWSICKL